MKIIDDFLSELQFKELNDSVMSHRFPWFYIESVSLPPEDRHFITDQQAMETDGFSHILFDRETDTTSFANTLFESFYNQIQKDLGYNKDHIIRSRLSLKLPKIGFTKENYNLPHVDYYYPHDTMIYYLNDSDGDTRMFNEIYTEGSEEYNSFTVDQLVTPKANRLVLFDGLKYHTASNPFLASRRVVLNLNFYKL